MFGVDFFELLVIAVVALLVIGPERLPAVARTLGKWLGRGQRYLAELKAGVHRELEWEEFRSLHVRAEETARDLEDEIRRDLHELASAAESTADSSGNKLPVDRP